MAFHSRGVFHCMTIAHFVPSTLKGHPGGVQFGAGVNKVPVLVTCTLLSRRCCNRAQSEKWENNKHGQGQPCRLPRAVTSASAVGLRVSMVGLGAGIATGGRSPGQNGLGPSSGCWSVKVPSASLPLAQFRADFPRGQPCPRTPWGREV